MNDSILAIKALNQYRKRDVIPYLGLRYYLDNISARRDRWIQEISCPLVQNQSKVAYIKTYHFKEESNDGSYIHRDIYLPAPNEALAETALLNELSKIELFKSQPYVYSYYFADETDKVGVFKPYFNGLKERQKAIAKACHNTNNEIVLYTDIKKFYPSIQAKDALTVWKECSEKSVLSEEYVQLGEKLLANYKYVCAQDKSAGKGILTGPLFSHVIANLLLDKIDKEMHQITNGKYWRYVDDITLLGSENEVLNWRKKLQELLDELGLKLHSGDKDFQLSSDDWLESENDFESSMGIDWISLIADTKRFLIANPSQSSIDQLTSAFREKGIRLPLLDYSQAVKESNYLQRFNDWVNAYSMSNWSLKKIKRIDIEHLLCLVEIAKKSLQKELDDLLSKPIPLTPYERKRSVPKLRFLSGRLLFLVNSEELKTLAERLSDYPELSLLIHVMLAVATRDVTAILEMGSNATQAAAQLLRTSDNPVMFNIKTMDGIVDQSLAILTLNGIKYQCNDETLHSELRQFSLADNQSKLMSSEDGFIQEIACLHGIGEARHSSLLDQAFDRDEELALDVINQLQNSSHC